MKAIVALLSIIALCVVASTAAVFVRRIDVDLVTSLASELIRERGSLRETVAKANAEITRANGEIEKANADNARLVADLEACREKR